MINYSIRTNSIVWEYPYDFGVHSDLAIFNDFVLVGSRKSFSGGVKTEAYSKSTGELLWASQEPRGYPILTDGELVYILSGELLESTYRISLNKVIAYQIDTGTNQWELSLPYSNKRWGKMAVNESYLAIGFSNPNRLIIIDTFNKSIVDSFYIPSSRRSQYLSSIIFTSDYLFFGDNNNIYAYDLEAQKIAWSESVSNSDIIVANNYLYVLSRNGVVVYGN